MAVDIDAAIRAHAQWKSRLSSYLRQPDGSIDKSVLGRSDRCDLGKWLAVDARRELTAAQREALEAAHAAFHVAAADVVARADSNVNVLEEVALGARSPYGLASSKVTQLLTALRK